MHLVVLANRMLINANYVLCNTKIKNIYRVSFLANPTVDGALKSISGTPTGDFLISRMFQIRTKSFNCGV